MDTYLAIASKRDVREYAETPIPDDVVHRILDAGRLAGSSRNRQEREFVVVSDKKTLAKAVFAPENVLGAALVVAIAGSASGFDVGRAAQNMMLAAWNDGVVSCPNGMPDAAAAAEALGLEGDAQPVIVLTFGYPRRPHEPESKSPEDWSSEANRKPLEDLVKRG